MLHGIYELQEDILYEEIIAYKAVLFCDLTEKIAIGAVVENHVDGRSVLVIDDPMEFDNAWMVSSARLLVQVYFDLLMILVTVIIVCGFKETFDGEVARCVRRRIDIESTIDNAVTSATKYVSKAKSELTILNQVATEVFEDSRSASRPVVDGSVGKEWKEFAQRCFTVWIAKVEERVCERAAIASDSIIRRVSGPVCSQTNRQGVFGSCCEYLESS